MTTQPDDRLDRFLWQARGDRLRWSLAVCAAIGALAHVPVVGEHLREAPYMGWEFVVLIAACLAIAAAAVYCDSAAVYAGAALSCGLAVLGYILTRLIAFPQLSDDVGNWFEPLGVVSIAAETAVVGIAVAALCKDPTIEPIIDTH